MIKRRGVSKSNNKVVLGTIGTILAVIGVLASISLAVNKLTGWMFLSGFVVIIGIVLLAYSFSD